MSEVLATAGVYIAFLPMNLSFIMDIDQASSAVAEFKPAVLSHLLPQGQGRRESSVPLNLFQEEYPF
jgi:hypothetical protein